MAVIFLRFLCALFIFMPVDFCSSTSAITYNAKIIGLEKFPELASAAKNLSPLLSHETDIPPGSEGVLRDLLHDDIQRIKTYLESYGFYDVRLFSEIEAISDTIYNITLHVDTGEQYTINRIKVFVNGKKFPIDSELLSAQKDAPAINELILKDKNKISMFLKQNGYAVVEILDENVTVNHAALFVNITYSFKTGPKGTFGNYNIQGTQSVKEFYIEKFIRWKVGEPYNIDYVNETEALLMATGLFETVLITASPPVVGEQFPLSIKLTERKPNHLQFNVYGNIALSQQETNRYEVGCIPKYVHDNIGGCNEKLEISSLLSTKIQDINISIKKPHFLLFNNNGRVFFSGERRTYDAYYRLGVDGGAALEYKLTNYLSVEGGVLYERYSLERQTTGREKNLYNFCGFPFLFSIDTRENKIFSNSGIQLEATWTPYIGAEQLMNQASIKGKIYLPIITEYFIIAGWAQWNLLSGIVFDRSPMDKRVYLGGIQDLRGYSKSSLGKSASLESTPDKFVPVGGLSGIAAGIEPRFRIYKQFWCALFCDVGQISETENVFKELRDFSSLYWDCGVSFFYFADFGPLRLDIAYPFGNGLKDTDKEFKYYFSFGQAF